MNEKLSYLSVVPHIKKLRASGMYELDEKSSKFAKCLHSIYMRGVLLSYAVYTVQQLTKIYEVRDKVDEVMGTMFLLLTYTDCIYKCLVFRQNPRKIGQILNVLKGPLFNQGDPEHRNILTDTIRNALLVFRIFNYMSLTTCFLWVLHPTVKHMQGKYIEFPVWLPFDVNTNPQYYIAVFYVWLQTSWLAYGNTTMDIFVVFLFEQCRTQISILRLNLFNVVKKSKQETETTTYSYNDILEKRLKNIIIHHKEIVNTADKIQDIFAGALFYQFFVSGWILCTSAYRIASANPASIEFVSMIMYVNCILIQVFVYCYYGNELTYESVKLMESAYTIDWLELSLEHRRTLIIFMERIKKPIQPMAGYIIPLSSGTFISILRSSYSFYTFLKNSQH